jgi:hypothetical protein
VAGEAKLALTVPALVAKVHEASKGDLTDDRVLLSGGNR